MHRGVTRVYNETEINEVIEMFNDEMAEHINNMAVDYHTFENELRWKVHC